MIGTIIPSVYLFVYLFLIDIYISFFIFLFIFLFFLMTNKIFVVREHFVILILNKYLVLEFWLG